MPAVFAIDPNVEFEREDQHSKHVLLVDGLVLDQANPWHPNSCFATQDLPLFQKSRAWFATDNRAPWNQ
jgi:hypothetical protein